MAACSVINGQLAAAVGVRGYQAPSELDVPLLKRAMRCPRASDRGLLLLLIDVAQQSAAAENRALLSQDAKEAATHWAAADECRRRAGIPESCWKNNPRRTCL